MKKSTQILEVLKLSYLVYDNVREMYFHRWCAIWAQRKSMSIQMMVTNDHLRNYYHSKWIEKVERQFLKENLDYISNELQKDIAQELFYSYTDELNHFAPTFLLTEIKQQSYVIDQTRSKQTN